MCSYYSQCGQDKFLHERVFKNFTKGVFVDVGAHDGKSINNTLFFEESLQWTGINIEPNPEIFTKLTHNRPSCINIKCAVDLRDGTSDFILNTGYTEMLSGLKEHYDTRHFDRLHHEICGNGGSTQIVQVETKRLDGIFDLHNINRVHYLSIDIEGGEWAAIQSINFEKVYIDVIEFENNYPDSSSEILSFLGSKGYLSVPGNDSWDVMMIHKDSQFNTF
jgi:FkbM family methyltransferase